MRPRPCDAKSSSAGFLILSEVGNETGSRSTHEVSQCCLQGQTASPVTGYELYQLRCFKHTRGRPTCLPTKASGTPAFKPDNYPAKHHLPNLVVQPGQHFANPPLVAGLFQQPMGMLGILPIIQPGAIEPCETAADLNGNNSVPDP